jgi:hypothetical protein
MVNAGRPGGIRVVAAAIAAECDAGIVVVIGSIVVAVAAIGTPPWGKLLLFSNLN